jgi:hypothetical protein
MFHRLLTFIKTETQYLRLIRIKPPQRNFRLKNVSLTIGAFSMFLRTNVSVQLSHEDLLKIIGEFSTQKQQSIRNMQSPLHSEEQIVELENEISKQEAPLAELHKKLEPYYTEKKNLESRIKAVQSPSVDISFLVSLLDAEVRLYVKYDIENDNKVVFAATAYNRRGEYVSSGVDAKICETLRSLIASTSIDIEAENIERRYDDTLSECQYYTRTFNLIKKNPDDYRDIFQLVQEFVDTLYAQVKPDSSLTLAYKSWQSNALSNEGRTKRINEKAELMKYLGGVDVKIEEINNQIRQIEDQLKPSKEQRQLLVTRNYKVEKDLEKQIIQNANFLYEKLIPTLNEIIKNSLSDHPFRHEVLVKSISHNDNHAVELSLNTNCCKSDDFDNLVDFIIQHVLKISEIYSNRSLTLNNGKMEGAIILRERRCGYLERDIDSVILNAITNKITPLNQSQVSTNNISGAKL